MNKPEPTQKKRGPLTFLEIGAGEKPAIHLMPKIRRGDKYVSVDVRPLGASDKRRVNLSGVKSLPTSADALAIPLRTGSVDHVISSNVISESWFPRIYTRTEFRSLSFRKALEKIEEELHRVTKPGGTITFHEQYTPGVLDYKEGELGEEEASFSRIDHLKQVFGRRWRIKFCNIPKEFEGTIGSSVLIKLFKK